MKVWGVALDSGEDVVKGKIYRLTQHIDDKDYFTFYDDVNDQRAWFKSYFQVLYCNTIEILYGIEI